MSEKVAAHCMDCGADRRVSITDLKAGIAPCLACAELADPDAPHAVYLMHFPELNACKIGITNSEARHSRVASHVAHGGVLREQHEVPNREAARTVEDFVLRAVRVFPANCKEHDFPQGGDTETWSDSVPGIDLGDIVAGLVSQEAPGFDRLSKLKAYFEDKPPTIEELKNFILVEIIEVAGGEVRRVGFSEPQEQVLRKIRARRAEAATAEAVSRLEYEV
jgi:hypothetical protein